MSGPVDVLAVLERLEDYYRRHEALIGSVDDAYSVEHKAARLAIVELVASSRVLLEEWDRHDNGKFDIMPAKDWAAAEARFRAAVAGAGGAK